MLNLTKRAGFFWDSVVLTHLTVFYIAKTKSIDIALKFNRVYGNKPETLRVIENSF